MTNDELALGNFIAAQMKERGFNVKKLSEATGIAPAHIENIVHGNFDDLPSAPYLRGYIIRIGKVLGFDGGEWWKQLRGADVIANSGPADSLPANRFVRGAMPKWIWPAAIIAAIVAAYLLFSLPRIMGKPSLAISYPGNNPFLSTSTSVTFNGTVGNADALYLSNGNASSSEEIPVAPDGTWQKTVLLQNGLNTFDFVAKKFLGAETDIMKQVLYESGSSTAAAATSTQIAQPAGQSAQTSTATGSSILP